MGEYSVQDSEGPCMKFHQLRQRFERPRLENVESEVLDQIEGSGVGFGKGASIAIAAGSRGIANIAVITRAIVDAVRAGGARPFILPPMGSHWTAG